MKWKLELVATMTLASQMIFVFFAWWLKFLDTEEAPLFIAIGVFAIGLAGCSIMAVVKQKRSRENHSLEKAIRIIGALLASAGIYAIFFPAFSIIYHSAISAFLLLLGIVAPWVVQWIIPSKPEGQNA